MLAISVVALGWVATRQGAPAEEPAPFNSTPTPVTEPETTRPADAVPTDTTAPEPEVHERYVAMDGDDGASGGPDDPWQTIAAALPRLEAGDTLFLHEGVYNEAIRVDGLNAGTASAPITVTPYPREEPVIRGLLWLTEPDYWVLDGLTIEWNSDLADARNHMVKITGGEGWRITNTELRNARSFAALLVAEGEQGPPLDWRIDHNCIHDTIPSNDRNQDHLIYINTGEGSTGGVIERNLLWGAPNGSGIKLGGSSPDSGGAAGVTARFNTIVSTDQSFVVAWRASDNTIESNLMAIIPEGRSHIRAFELEGNGNVATSNLADIKPLVWADDGYETVEAGPGNEVGVNPQFTRPQTCDGWIADGTIGTSFGHLATEP